MIFSDHARTAYENYNVSDNPDHRVLYSFDAPLATQHNQQEIPCKEIGSGCWIMGVADFCKHYADLADAFMNIAHQSWKHRQIYAYTDASASQTVIVYIKPGTILTEPIALHTLIEDTEPVSSYKIIIGARAQVTIVDTHNPSSSSCIRSIAYHVGQYATLSIMHDLHVHEVQVASAHLVCADAYATVTMQAVLTAGPDTRTWFDIMTHDRGSSVTVRGISIAATGGQRLSIVSEQWHQAPHTAIDLSFAACVVADAHVSYHGRIHIEQCAQHTESKQRNKMLLESTAARAVSVPSLEALAHEVHCVHATAIGMLDYEQVQYLQSRGLSRMHARNLLLQGFIQEAVTDQALAARAAAYIR